MSTENQNLNLNRAKQDKFTLILSDIPSSVLLNPTGLTGSNLIYNNQSDRNAFALSLQSVEMPGVSLNESKVQGTHAAVSQTDMELTYDPFVTEVKIDENYVIYKLLVLWLYLIKNPEGYNQYDMSKTYERTYVQGTLIMNNNFNTPVMEVDFYDLRPLQVPPMSLSYTGSEEMKISVTWAYSYFMPRDVNSTPISLTLEDI
jgi:hypothetical protein